MLDYDLLILSNFTSDGMQTEHQAGHLLTAANQGTMESVDQTKSPRELEQELRAELLTAWSEFANGPAGTADGHNDPMKADAFFRYQRALTRLNNLILYGTPKDFF